MLNLLTYNIHKGFGRFNREFVLHEIRDQLRNLPVDIVFLQEIQGHHSGHASRIQGWPKVSQFEFLAHQLWPHYTYGKNAIYNKGHHGNAILSKYHFDEWQNVNLSRFRWASRSLLHGVIRSKGSREKIHLICVHLELLGFERSRQLNILRKYIQQAIDDDAPLIVAGDFNDWSGKTGIELERQLGMQEVFRCSQGRNAKTFPAHRPMLCMDRIYFRGLNLIEGQCLSGHPWGRLSDHLPLYAQFE